MGSAVSAQYLSISELLIDLLNDIQENGSCRSRALNISHDEALDMHYDKKDDSNDGSRISMKPKSQEYTELLKELLKSFDDASRMTLSQLVGYVEQQKVLIKHSFEIYRNKE